MAYKLITDDGAKLSGLAHRVRGRHHQLQSGRFQRGLNANTLTLNASTKLEITHSTGYGMEQGMMYENDASFTTPINPTATNQNCALILTLNANTNTCTVSINYNYTGTLSNVGDMTSTATGIRDVLLATFTNTSAGAIDFVQSRKMIPDTDTAIYLDTVEKEKLQINNLTSIGYSDATNTLFDIPRLLKEKTLADYSVCSHYLVSTSSFPNLHTGIKNFLKSYGYEESSTINFSIKYESRRYSTPTSLNGLLTIEANNIDGSSPNFPLRKYVATIIDSNNKIPILETQISPLNINDANFATSSGYYFVSNGNIPFGLTTCYVETKVLSTLASTGVRAIRQIAKTTQSSNTNTVTWERLGTSVAPDGSAGTYTNWVMTSGEIKSSNNTIISSTIVDVPFLEFAKEIKAGVTFNSGISKDMIFYLQKDVLASGNLLFVGSLTWIEVGTDTIKYDGVMSFEVSTTGSIQALKADYTRTTKAVSSSTPVTTTWVTPSSGVFKIFSSSLTIIK